MVSKTFLSNFARKSLVFAAALVGFAGATSASADSNFTGGVWAVNDFMDYGVSRTEHKPAFQAELAYEMPKNVYAGMFTSSVHDGVDYGQEFQAMLGFATEIEGFGVDAFVNNHMFAGQGDFHEESFWEVEVDVTRGFGPVEATAALVGGPVDGTWSGFGFLGFESEHELPHNFALKGTFGRLMFSDAAEEDYFLYASGVAWTHPRGFEIFGGLEGVSLDGKLHPVLRIGRAF